MAMPFSLVPYVEGTYGPNCPWCWIHEYKGEVNGEGLLAFRIAFRLPVIIGTMTCVSLMRQLIAVRIGAPILIYPIVFALASIRSTLHPIVRRALSVSDDTSTIYDVEMVFLTMFFIYDMSIPLSLFLHKEIRVSLSNRCATCYCRRRDPKDFYVSYEEHRYNF